MLQAPPPRLRPTFLPEFTLQDKLADIHTGAWAETEKTRNLRNASTIQDRELSFKYEVKKKKKIFGIDLLENTPRESTPEKMKTSSREYYIWQMKVSKSHSKAYFWVH